VLVRAGIHFNFATAEHLSLGRKLTMDFETDNRTVIRHVKLQKILRGKDSN
jgi:hypothetical protein